jgi:hypothetical protein
MAFPSGPHVKACQQGVGAHWRTMARLIALVDTIPMPQLHWTRLLPVAFLWLHSGLSADPSTTALARASRPVFQVDVASPTKDKPQSKIWFAHGSWWAWLPTRDGSSIWKRTDTGWQRQASLDRALGGLPGQADVWADRDTVRAVLVEARRVAVVGLQWDSTSKGYVPAGPPVQFVMPGGAEAKGTIETATIARGSGRRATAPDRSGANPSSSVRRAPRRTTCAPSSRCPVEWA